MEREIIKGYAKNVMSSGGLDVNAVIPSLARWVHVLGMIHLIVGLGTALKIHHRIGLALQTVKSCLIVPLRGVIMTIQLVKPGVWIIFVQNLRPTAVMLIMTAKSALMETALLNVTVATIARPRATRITLNV